MNAMKIFEKLLLNIVEKSLICTSRGSVETVTGEVWYDFPFGGSKVIVRELES